MTDEPKRTRGRPRLSAAPFESLTIRIPRDLRKRAEADAKAKKCANLSAWIRAACEAALPPLD